MPLPRERLCQDFEQGAPLMPNPCQGSVPGKDRGFPLVFNKHRSIRTVHCIGYVV